MIISIKLKQQLLLLLLLLLQQVLFIFSCYYSSLGCCLFQHQQLQFLLVLLTSRLMWHYQLPQNIKKHKIFHIPMVCIFIVRIMLDTKFCLS
jgi:hypothetical protein